MLGILAALCYEIFYANCKRLIILFQRRILHAHKYHTCCCFVAGTLQLKLSVKLKLVIQCTFCRHIAPEQCKLRIKIFYIECTLQQSTFSCTKSSLDKNFFDSFSLWLLMVNVVCPGM